eukprot:134806-Pyramimonas_sp.AAC.1
MRDKVRTMGHSRRWRAQRDRGHLRRVLDSPHATSTGVPNARRRGDFYIDKPPAPDLEPQ